MSSCSTTPPTAATPSRKATATARTPRTTTIPAAARTTTSPSTADSDEAWESICEFLRADDLFANEDWQTAAGRYRDQEALDQALAEHTRKHDQRALFFGLQAAGVIAGPVQNEAAAYACPQLAERGFFEETGNTSTGTHLYPGLNLRMANTPNHIRTGPPLLGEHNEYVYREVMGYTEEQYRALEEIEQIGFGYAPGVAPFAVET